MIISILATIPMILVLCFFFGFTLFPEDLEGYDNFFLDFLLIMLVGAVAILVFSIIIGVPFGSLFLFLWGITNIFQ